MVKKGDTVLILAGKDKGKTGKVLKTIAKKDRVIVEGIKMVESLILKPQSMCQM